jgi:inorganic triphosphatase YgiF
VGRTLLQITRWLELEAIDTPSKAGKHTTHAAAKWLHKRVTHLAEELKATQRLATQEPQSQHRLRIVSKRLRYAVESLHGLLPPKRAERWYRTATAMQTHIGLERDRQQAIATAERLRAAPGIVGFLRGAAFAAAHASPGTQA